MTRMVRSTLLTAAVSLACSLPGSSVDAETVLRAITYAPPNKVEDSMVVFRDWVDRVNKASKGALRINHLGGPEVFPVADQINAANKGLVDIVMTFSVHTALVPEIDTTGLSDISIEEERKLGYVDLLDKAHEKINLKVIGRTATASGFYIFSKAPINKLDDFKGVKIRSHSGYDPLFKSVGAVPIGMNISEIYGGLERGIVSAAPYPLFVHDMGLHEVTKFVLSDAFWTSHTTWTFINLKKFQSLSPDLQSVLINTQLEIEKEMPRVVADMKAKERAKLEGAGMTFTSLSPDEGKKWRRMADESRFNALVPRLGPEQTAKIKGMIVRE